PVNAARALLPRGSASPLARHCRRERADRRRARINASIRPRQIDLLPERRHFGPRVEHVRHLVPRRHRACARRSKSSGLRCSTAYGNPAPRERPEETIEQTPQARPLRAARKTRCRSPPRSTLNSTVCGIHLPSSTRFAGGGGSTVTSSKKLGWSRLAIEVEV